MSSTRSGEIEAVCGAGIDDIELPAPLAPTTEPIPFASTNFVLGGALNMSTVVVSPSADRIAFTEWPEDSRANGESVIVTAQGAELHRLPAGVVSDDINTALVTASSPERLQVYDLSGDTASVFELNLPNGADVRYSIEDLSADGQTVVLEATKRDFNADGRFYLVIVDLAAGATYELGTNAYRANVARNGNFVTYVGRPNGIDDGQPRTVIRFDLQTGQHEEISAGAPIDFPVDAVISDSERWLAYVSSAGVYLRDLSAQNATVDQQVLFDDVRGPVLTSARFVNNEQTLLFYTNSFVPNVSSSLSAPRIIVAYDIESGQFDVYGSGADEWRSSDSHRVPERNRVPANSDASLIGVVDQNPAGDYQLFLGMR